MTKFKKGDRVRVIGRNDRWTGATGTVAENCSRVPWIIFDDSTLNLTKSVTAGARATAIDQSSLKLIKEPTYTKLTPKVGDRFRVVKPCEAFVFHEQMRFGDIVDMDLDDGRHYRWNKNGEYFCYSEKSGLTTEYLEPIEEEKSLLSKDLMYAYKTLSEGTACVYGIDYGIEPTNKTITTKLMDALHKLNNWQKRTFNADTQAQYRAGFINNDLTPTQKGKDELTAILFASHSKELTERANEIIAESEAEK